MMPNYLATLGLLRFPKSADELHAAYRNKARSTHPDNGGKKESFVAVRAAYDVLRDPEKLQKWVLEYKAHYERDGLEVCEKCLAPTLPQSRVCICGPKPERTKADTLRDDLVAQLGDFVIKVSATVGDQVADLAVSLVDRGVQQIQKQVLRKKRGK